MLITATETALSCVSDDITLALDNHDNIVQVPVVQKLDSAIHRINHYAVDKYYGNQLRCPVDSDLFGG